MSRPAKVQSIDSLPVFAVSVRKFGEEASVALAELEAEVNRAIQWLRYDQKEYWSQRIRQSENEVAEARLNLERKQMLQDPDERRSFWEEKKALEAAIRRLRISREKLEAVRRWSHLLDREFMEYKGSVAPVAGWLATDLPRGLSLLKRLSGALESYVDLEPPAEAAESLPDASAGSGDPRPAEPKEMTNDE
jgi:hypothetical protein